MQDFIETDDFVVNTNSCNVINDNNLITNEIGCNEQKRLNAVTVETDCEVGTMAEGCYGVWDNEETVTSEKDCRLSAVTDPLDSNEQEEPLLRQIDYGSMPGWRFDLLMP